MSPHLGRLAARLDAMERRLVEQDQRLARTILHGKVHQVRKEGEDWQVRLDLGRDPGAGEPVLSPWVPVQPASAGALKIKVKPSEGERMAMLSPSGVVGTASFATRAPFDADHPAPEGEEPVVLEVGKSRIIVADGKIAMSDGKASVTIADGKVAVGGDGLTHNGTDISEAHVHQDVQPGTGESGRPKKA